MPGWEGLASQIELERQQLIEEGAVDSAARAAAATARALLDRGAPEAEIWAAFNDVPRRADFPFVEPSDLEGIRAARPDGPRQLTYQPTDDQLFDQMYGAWLGRCVGCALGKPVEPLMGSRGEVPSWQRQKSYLTAISANEWPLKDYFPAQSPAADKADFLDCPPSQREHIAYMESDDDIRYTVLGQIVMARYGRNFRSSHVAHAWLNFLPYSLVCTAETQAYRNMVIRYDHFRREPSPEKAAANDAATDWQWLVHHLNPYREWIGAQIRIDSYAYAAAGNPELAAEFAWRDARISHVKNGIYGAMFCSAMIAAAFATKDVRDIIHIGLSEIPKQSRLHAEMTQVIAVCDKHSCKFEKFEAVFAELYALLGHYHPVHTNNNAGLCVIALLLSGGDFHKGITLAVMGGLDTDCNGATVGSIVGAIAGAVKAPTHWTGRLNDKLLSLVPDYHPIAISECARKAAAIFRSVSAESDAIK